jgi:hypothetical protein
LSCSANWHDYDSRASFPVLPATVAMLLCQHHSLLSVTTVTSNDAIKVTIYNCRKGACGHPIGKMLSMLLPAGFRSRGRGTGPEVY